MRVNGKTGSAVLFALLLTIPLDTLSADDIVRDLSVQADE